MHTRFLCRLTLVLAAAVLPACANVAAVRVPGKVVAGDVSFIGVVNEGDSRLDAASKDTAVAGAVVEITGTAGNVKGVNVGKATSDANGNFTIRLTDQDAVKGPASFRATAPEYLAAEATMLIPPSQRRVLVVLKRAR